jgi:hypothetical protein
VVVACAHRPTTRVGHRPWDRVAHRPVPATIPGARRRRLRGCGPVSMLSSWRRPVPRRDARSGWGNGGGGANASCVSMARCPHPAPEGWPSSRRPAALSGGPVRPTTPGAWDAPGVVVRWSTLATVRTLAFPPASRDATAADNLVGNSGQLSNHSGAITDAPGYPWTGASRGPLIPPLMGPSTPPSMGPSGGEGAVVAALGLFALLRRYVGVRPIDRAPVDGPPSSAHSGRNRGRRTIEPSLRAGRAFVRIPENQLAATPPPPVIQRGRVTEDGRIDNSPVSYRWREGAGSVRGSLGVGRDA